MTTTETTAVTMDTAATVAAGMIAMAIVAVIVLNGKEILGSNDFNQHTGRIVKPVVLTDQDQLTIKLASDPGSFLIVKVECVASPVVLSATGPGVSSPDPTTLLSALPIMNTGTVAALNVQLTAITLNGGLLTSPASLPAGLGTIPAGSSSILNADFTGGPFTPSGSYTLIVQGTYGVVAAHHRDEHGDDDHDEWGDNHGDDKLGDGDDIRTNVYCFTLTNNLIVPPAAPGSAPVSSVTVVPNVVSGGGFPPQTPSFDENDVNSPFWTVPTAPPVPGTPTPTSTAVTPAPIGDPPMIDFVANDGLGINASPTAEPSGATGGGVIFVSGNWFAAYSTNGGMSFTQLNPTTVFPTDAVGFCCDQVVQYVPSIDRFIWLLQGNGYRLATASPAQIVNSRGTAWTYWNLTPQVFGQPSGAGFDYPDLSVGNNYLYMGWDAGAPCPSGCLSGRQVARTSLAGIQAGGSIGIDYTNPTNSPQAWGSHLMQDTLDEIFWSGHNNNSQIRVFSLAEGSNTYFWRDVGISSWANTAPITSLTPDSKNWLNFMFNPTSQNPGGGFPGNSILGATRSGDQLWFAWSAGTNNNFQQAHVEMVTLDRNNNFNVLQQVQIWNSSYAFAYPALAIDACTEEVGLSLEFGGGGNYENHVVGLWGDFTVYTTTASNVGGTRFGDYVTIRQAPPTDANPGNLFTAYGYGLKTNSVTDVHYILFGRPASSCPSPIK